MQQLEDAFSADYYEARDRFCRQARNIGWSLGRHHFLSGSDGSQSDLSIDWASAGTDDPVQTLILSSGLHGVEGFFGSALQLAALESVFSEWSPPPGLNVVCVHALNPYGFANRRRFDERNIDPNRNFRLPHEDCTGCPAHYRRLNHWLNPTTPPPRIDFFRWQAVAAILRYGLPTLQQVIAGGQHEFPLGLFFGGQERSTVFNCFQSLWAEWTKQADRVLHLDIHTGLGRSGTYKLLLDTVVCDGEIRWLSENFGHEQVKASDSAEAAYQPGGSLGHWCRETYEGGQYLYLCAEFGTYGPMTVLAALRAENRAHHYAARSSVAFNHAKARLVDTFCPRNPAWRRTALENGIGLVTRALKALDDTS